MDTAGIRPTRDEIEKMGVERSHQAIADSDLRLLVVDAAEGWTVEDTDLLRRLLPVGAVLVACNKVDLPSRLSEAELQAALAKADPSALAQSEVTAGFPVEVVWTSALTGQGLPQLREKILEVAAPARDLGPEDQFITNLRHQQLIRESVAALTCAREAATHQIPHEMLLIDLYDALRPLDQLTGATYVDDLLNIIFSTFCVGK
jgi:tRNA modification GTPase